MASALTVSLPEELDEFVSRRVREEAYADAGEYLRALIRADRRRAVEEKIEQLVEEALGSGPARDDERCRLDRDAPCS